MNDTLSQKTETIGQLCSTEELAEYTYLADIMNSVSSPEESDDWLFYDDPDYQNSQRAHDFSRAFFWGYLPPDLLKVPETKLAALLDIEKNAIEFNDIENPQTDPLPVDEQDVEVSAAWNF